MSRFVNRKSIISVLVALTLVAAFAGGVFLRGSGTRAHASGGTRLGAGNNNPICGRLGKSLQGSQGMQMWCFGPQTSSKSVHQSTSISFIGCRAMGSRKNPLPPLVPMLSKRGTIPLASYLRLAHR